MTALIFWEVDCPVPIRMDGTEYVTGAKKMQNSLDIFGSCAIVFVLLKRAMAIF